MGKSRILSRTPITLTQDEVDSWEKARHRTRSRSDFGCLLSGRMFKAGDTIRWIYANGSGSPFRGGNFHVLESSYQEAGGTDEAVLQKASSLLSGMNRLLVLRHPASWEDQ